MLIKSLCHHAGHQVIRLIKLVLLIRSVIIDQFDHIGQINCFDQVLYNICTYHHSPGNYACAGRVNINIAKGTTDPRVEFCSDLTQILIKFHLQNLNQPLTSKSQPNISISPKLKILTKASFRISTKIQLHKLYKTSAAKY